MATSIPPTPHEILTSQIRESYAKVAYSHKTHEKCADALLRSHGRIVLWQIALSALTTTSLLVAVFGDRKQGTIIGAFLSTILLALNTYTKDKDMDALASRHGETARKLLSLRDAYLSLLTDMTAGFASDTDALRRRDELAMQLDQVYANAPRTNDASYRSAQNALKKQEDLTFSDEEIDAFLPGPLKKNKAIPIRNDQGG